MAKKGENIEQLYRESFKDFRIEPSSGIWKKISSKLIWKNFISFTPTSFNAYYLAGIFAVATAGTLLLTKPELKTSPEKQELIINNAIEKQVTNTSTKDKTTTKPKPHTQNNQKRETSNEKPKASQQSAIGPPSLSTALRASEGQSSQQSAVGPPSLSTALRASEGQSSQQSAVGPPSLSTALRASEGRSSRQLAKEGIQKTDSSINNIEVRNTHTIPKTLTPQLVTRNVNRSVAKVDNTELVTRNPKPVTRNTELVTRNTKLVTRNTKHNLQQNIIDSLPITNNNTPPAHALLFPNAFTPNPNGPTNGYYTPGIPNNDVFHPVYKGVSEYHLYIYNRRGELIFESNDINIGWDGYINDRPASQGVYIWKAKGKYSNGENFIKAGNVLLIKK